jgi:hypothetical protein
MPYFIQKTKWTPGKVTIVHNGPYKTHEDALERMKSLRKSKHTDLTIIEKETNDS